MKRIRTTVEDEELLVALDDAMYGELSDSHHKWHLLRLALAISFRRELESGERGSAPKGPFSQGYLPKQALGFGKGDEDHTGVLRALLSTLHSEDLFAEDQDDRLRELLEFHIHRGFQLFRKRWAPSSGADPFPVLASILAQGTDGSIVADAPLAPELIKSVVESELGVRLDGLPDIVTGPRITRYVITVADGHALAALKNHFDRLPFVLGLRQDSISWAPAAKARSVSIDILRGRDSWRVFDGQDLQRWARSVKSEGLVVCPGVDVLGEPLWIDLVTEGPHTLIAGATGSGKSVALHALVCSLLLRMAPNDLKLCLIDPKVVELSRYRSLPHASEFGVLTEPSDITSALSLVVDEMERRFELMESVDARNLVDARARLQEPLPWLVVVVEELADLVLQTPDAEGHLVRLAQKARAAGIHLILATQRPDAETFKGLLRSNVDLRIALAVQRASESRIILGESGAESLPKPGDMLVRRPGKEPIRLHGVWVDDGDIDRVVQSAAKGAPH